MIRAASRPVLQEVLAPLRSPGARIGLVPTMGYLHEGHLSLIDIARRDCETVAVSIFVNPLQFGPGEDLERYPRDLERDASMAEERGADVLFVPSTDEMYPAGEVEVVVDAPRLADRMCGAFRPGHFRGVLTVVAKLFNIVRPDVAVFGRKDFQQLALIRRMVADLDMAVEIVGGPIVREPDGLAMSSRNVYLGGEERQQATLLNQGLRDANTAFAAGETRADPLIRTVRDRLDTGSHVKPQYIELIRPDDLSSIGTATRGSVLAVAAYVGATRLIDNIVLGEDV